MYLLYYKNTYTQVMYYKIVYKCKKYKQQPKYSKKNDWITEDTSTQESTIQLLNKKRMENIWESPGGPVLGLSTHCWGPKFNPCLGIKIPQAT